MLTFDFELGVSVSRSRSKVHRRRIIITGLLSALLVLGVVQPAAAADDPEAITLSSISISRSSNGDFSVAATMTATDVDDSAATCWETYSVTPCDFYLDLRHIDDEVTSNFASNRVFGAVGSPYTHAFSASGVAKKVTDIRIHVDQDGRRFISGWTPVADPVDPQLTLDVNSVGRNATTDDFEYNFTEHATDLATAQAVCPSQYATCYSYLQAGDGACANWFEVNAGLHDGRYFECKGAK